MAKKKTVRKAAAKGVTLARSGQASRKPASKPKRLRTKSADAADGGPLAAFCRTLPGTTEDIKWGDNLIFSIGKKMYAGFDTDGSGNYAFKCSDEDFWGLVQRDGIIPAPYMAKAFWVAVQKRRALPMGEAKVMLRKAYGVILSGLSKKAQSQIAATSG